MPGKDREDAIEQNRSDLDTHIPGSAPDTDEAQTRGQRHRQRLPHRPERKPKHG